METMRGNQVRFPMTRSGFNKGGRRISVLANYFQVTVAPPADGCFYVYTVTIKLTDGFPVGVEAMRRRILDNLDLGGREFAYDGGRSVFTIAPLLQDDLVQLDAIVDNVNVSIVYEKTIPMRANNGDGDGGEQLRVLDAILRHSANKDGCFVIGEAWFPYEGKNLNGGIASYRGHCSSFKTTQGGVTLNLDASTASIISAGTVKEFLLLHQGVARAAKIDWVKAKGALSDLWIKDFHSNMEYKVTGLSDLRCSEQTFLFKRETGGAETEELEVTEEMEMTVYDYYVVHLNIQLHESGDFPCVAVGEHNRPVYIPIELCSLVPLQRYTEPLSCEQQAQGPGQMMGDLKQALLSCNYDANSLLNSCGVSIRTEFTRVTARVLTPLPLLFGSMKIVTSNTGMWDIERLKLVCAIKLENWAAVNFSSPCDMRKLCQDLVTCGETIGYPINEPLGMLEEKPENANKPALVRVDEMMAEVLMELGQVPKFLLCILPEKKNCHLYGPLKRKTFSEIGIPTQCVAVPCASQPPTDYIRNMLLKINAKRFGLNWVLAFENPRYMPPPRICEVPTFIIGLSLCHAPRKPSVAAAVGSVRWPGASRYTAATRSQAPGSDIIEALVDRCSPARDRGIFKELLHMHLQFQPKELPDRIIIFRDGDGLSESQFDQVLNVELEQIVQACKFVKESWCPKMMVVVARKRHHTRFFYAKFPTHNVPAGTVVDTGVCHPRNNDFYLCAQAGTLGTTRPTHYQVLCDEIGCTASEIHEFVQALSFVYQPSNRAVSMVAPILYARRAAAQMFEIAQDLEPGQDPARVPPLPRPHRNVASSMFFC
ncbi:hypothetical protein OROGR_007475 [Orobanche gracilis]